MNASTTIAAAALLTTPVCMVAQATVTSPQEYAEKLYNVMEAMAVILEHTTPETADECLHALGNLGPYIQELKWTDPWIVQTFQRAAQNNVVYGLAMGTVAMRMLVAGAAVEERAKTATPREREKLQQVLAGLMLVMAFLGS